MNMLFVPPRSMDVTMSQTAINNGFEDFSCQTRVESASSAGESLNDMDKEMDQELKWLEAQKIEISVDLFSASKQQLQFLGTVDRNRGLYDGPELERAIYRYNAYWLPLLANYTESSSTCQGPLVPPLDCEWIWHCHRLNPVTLDIDDLNSWSHFYKTSLLINPVQKLFRSDRLRGV
ncbi:hypothetical protein YC2023_033054 [Brassica napus]